ncbi:MAG: multicopper oxidase family protein, partial [Caldilineaceae bacterium]|nr:multicopper oxidase family protein [Caldilineaceae bacterium]
LVLVAVLLWIPQPAQAMPQTATVTIDLCATTGTMTMPDGLAVTIWGYALGDCTGSPAAQVPGPLLEAEAGDTVNITLHNNLSSATAMNISGMRLRPDMTGAAPGASTSYSFVAPEPGTYLYEAGLTPNSQHQVAMGLYGALVVRPAGAPTDAYNVTTAFDAEAVVLLSEIDPALNNRANPATFDMRNYKPRYSLINGKSYPDTAELAANFGDHTLLRYLNAGLLHHSMTVLGMRQQVIAQDGNLLAQPYTLVAETIAPGQTLDVFVDIPTADPGGDVR